MVFVLVSVVAEVHTFKIVRRSDLFLLHEMPLDEDLAIASDLVHKPSDVMLLTKEYMASTTLSQPPTLLGPQTGVGSVGC
jgi:hypothetical protein